MANSETSQGTGGYAAAILVAIGTTWTGIAASANAEGLGIVFSVALAASLLVMILHPASRVVFTMGLVLYALVLGPVLGFAIHIGWDKPIVVGPCLSHSFLELDPSVTHCLMMLPVLGVAGFACFGIARIIDQQGSFSVWVLRLTKILLTGLAITLFLVGIGRASRWPEPDKYIESLPILATVPPPADPPVRTIERKTSMPSSLPKIELLNIYEIPLTSEILVRRYCKSEDSCWLMFRSPTAEARSDDDKLRVSRWSYTDSSWPPKCEDREIVVGKSDTFLIREDKQHDLLIMHGINGDDQHVIDRRTLQFRAVSTRDLLDTTSSPKKWFAIAIVGILGAVFLEILRFRARIGLRRIANAASGILGADGWIVFDDGSSPIRLDLDAGFPPGPVLVLPLNSATHAGSPYRGHLFGDKFEVLPGERKKILRQMQWFLQSPFDSFSIALLIVSAVPLVTSWFAQGH